MRVITGHIALWDEDCPLPPLAPQRCGDGHACGRLWRDGIKAVAVVMGVAAMDKLVHLAARGALSMLLH